MATNLYVTITGPALSLLMYENVISVGNQRGFLLGEVNHNVINSISDSDIQDQKTEISICVTSSIPIPDSEKLCSASGKVDVVKLKYYLNDKLKEIVGWYSFKRNLGLHPHLLDRLFHKALCNVTKNHITPDLLTMCLLNTTVNNIGSTHIFNHKFMRYTNNQFEALPMRVHNLGETQNSEYRTTPSAVTLTKTFKHIVESTLQKKDRKTDIDLVSQVHHNLQKHLQSLIDDIAISEMHIAELEAANNELRNLSGPISNEVLLPQLLQENATTSTSISSRKTLMPKQSGDSQEVYHDERNSNNVDVTPKKELFGNKTPASVDPFEKNLNPEIKTAMAAQLRKHHNDTPQVLQPNKGRRNQQPGYRNFQQSNSAQQMHHDPLESSPPASTLVLTPVLTRIDYSQAVKKPGNVPVNQDTSHP